MNLAQMSNSVIFITALIILTGEKLNTSSSVNNLRTTSASPMIPVHYDIKLTLLVEKYDSNKTELSNVKNEYGSFLFYGKCNITIHILRSTQNIKLQALNLGINNWITTLTQNKDIIYKPDEFLYNTETNILDLHFFDVLSPGFYTLNMDLVGYITDNDTGNLFRSSEINKEENLIWLIVPHIQENGAQRLFPCWDEPHLKTTFNISIRHHRNFTVLSNMPVRAQDMDDDNFMWTHFHTSPPMSTYHVSIVMTNLPRIRINETINLWCKGCSRYASSLKYAERIIENITLHLRSEFNEVKIPKMDHIAIPSFPHNSTSKWGFIFHREADLIYDEESDPVMRKIEIARSIAPKIAYQWLGIAVSPSWWTDFWLHEGLAILFGEEAIIKVFNNSQIMDSFVVQSQYDSLHLDSHFDMNPPLINSLSEAELIFNFPRYMKVIVVLRMLQNTLTNIRFRRGIHTYLFMYRFDSVTIPKFWSIQEEVAKTFIPSNFLSWLIHKHYPVLDLKKKSLYWGTLTQIFNTSSYDKWWIPTSIMTSLHNTTNLWLTPRKPSVYVDYVEDWIIIDIQQAECLTVVVSNRETLCIRGYYRVNYESENWRKIAHYLNSKEYKNISVINRAKIIDDAFHFMTASKLNTSIFWEFTKYLSRETDYAAWYPVLKACEYMSNVFPLSKDEINFSHLKERIRELLANSLRKLGYEERPMENDLITCLRQEIAKWACTLELSECLYVAKFKLEQHLKDPKLFKILPGWKEWTYCKGFSMIVDTDTWPYLNEIWPGKPNNKYIEFLPCFQDTFIMNILYHFLTSKNSEKSKQNSTKTLSNEDTNMRINIFHSIVAKHIRNNDTLDYILSNFAAIKPKEISTTAALINIINHIYSTRQLHKVTLFLKAPNNKQIYLGHLASKVYRKIETRLSEIESQINHFQMLLN